MALIVLAAPCWTFTCQREEATFARWREHECDPALLAMHGDGCCRPYQLDAPCIEVDCDACGGFFDGRHPAASSQPRHFATAQQARERLEAAGWIGDGKDGWRCARCPVPFYITAAGHDAIAA